MKILEGPPREEMNVVEWHPSRTMIISVGLQTGLIYMWSIVTPQKWSALAPDFAEVEENVIYVEREDEYDIHPAEEIHQRRLDQEDETPDVLSVDRIEGAVDLLDTEAETDIFRMPVLLDLSDTDTEDDEIPVGPGTMRKRSPGAGREWMNTNDESSSRGAATTNGTSKGRARGRKKQ